MKKIIALLLVLCSLSVVMMSCKNNDKPIESDTESSADSSDVSDTQAGELFPKINDDLPDKMDFGGQKVRMVVRNNDKYSSEFDSENSLGGVLSTAVYRRQIAVEERLNVDLEIVKIGGTHGPFDQITTELEAGYDTYDVVAGSSYYASEYAMKGQYKNLSNLTNLDLTKEYWAQDMIDSLTISGATYFATGSISTYFYDSAYVMYFNKELASTYGIDSEAIYDEVLDGNWTFERMTTLTKDIYYDDGNGVEDEKDVYGFGLMISSGTDGFWSSFNMPCSQFDSNTGEMTYICDVDRLERVVTELNTFLWQSKGTVALVEGESSGITGAGQPNTYLYDTQLAEGKVVFVTDMLRATSGDTMRNMTADYGVLPYPKYDVDQEEYKTYVHDAMTLLCVPHTINSSKVDMVGAFLEVMCSESHNTVIPVYYEKVLKSRNVRDFQSVQMIDIILKGMWNDSFYFYNRTAGRINTKLLREQVAYNTNTVTSTYSSNYHSVNETLENVHIKYMEFSNN